jgi:hypothetical protein
MLTLLASAGVLGQVAVNPSTDGMPGAALFQKLLDWLAQSGLWLALASVILGGGILGLAQHMGSGVQAGKGRMIVLGGIAGGLLIGMAPSLINLLYSAARV